MTGALSDSQATALAQEMRLVARSMTQIAIRLADDLLARVDLYRAQVIKDLPGHDFTRADAIRVFSSDMEAATVT